MQGPGHPVGPLCPAHPFPGSDLLSPLQLPPESGAGPPGSRGHSEPGWAGAAGSCAGHSSLRRAQPGPCPPLPNTRGKGPASQGWLVGQQPRLWPWQSGPCRWVVSRWSGAACGGPGRGGPGQNAPTGPALGAGHPPVGWGVAQAGRSAGPALPTPHTHSEACRGRAGKDPKGQAYEEGKVLDSRLSRGQEWRELSPPPLPLWLFSKPFPSLSPARTAQASENGRREAGGGFGGQLCT